MVGETAQRVQAYHVLQAEEQSRRLSRIDQSLSTTVDLTGLQDVLAEALQFAQTTLGVYRGAKGESSPERELLRALMLSVSAPDGQVGVYFLREGFFVDRLEVPFPKSLCSNKTTL